MRRGRDFRAALAAELDERDRQRRALGRVGARTELIKKNERGVVADFENVDDIFHMRGECRERLLDRLLVADIGKNTVEDGNEASVVCRDMKPALGHEGKKSQRLERDSLAAGVGAGNDERVKIGAEADGDRHDRFSRDERMTRALEFNFPIRANLGLRRVHRKRQLRPRKNAVQLREHRIVDGQVLPMPRDLAGELGEYPLDFLTFFDKELSKRVIAVHGLHGLNEKRAAGRRHVVN